MEKVFFSQITQTVLTRALLVCIGLVGSVLISRLLGAEGRGNFIVLSTISLVGIQVCNLGLQSSNTYFISQDKTLLPQLLSNSVYISLLIGGATTLVLGSILLSYPKLLNIDNAFLIILSVLWIPFGLLYLLVQNLLIGLREIWAYNLIEIVSRMSFVGMIILLAWLTASSVLNFFIVSFFSMIFGLLLCLVFVYTKYTLSFHRFKLPNLFLSYGIKAYLAGLFAFLVLKVDLLMIQYILGAKDTGYYSIATSFADMLLILPIAVGTILFPKITSLKNKLEKWAQTKIVTIYMAFIMALAIIVFGMLVPHIIPILFGVEFTPSTDSVLILLPGIFFLSLEIALAQFLASIGLPVKLVYAWFYIFILNIVLNSILIPMLGIEGAAITSSICYFTIFLYVLYLVKNKNNSLTSHFNSY